MAEANDPRRLIVFGVIAGVTGVVLLVFLYNVRGVLLLTYVSALFAIGISPLVRAIERKVRWIGKLDAKLKEAQPTRNISIPT